MNVEADIRRTVQRHFGPPARQASDALVLIVLTLVVSTAALWLVILAGN